MRTIHWITAGILLLAIASCAGKPAEVKELPTVKIDTVHSATAGSLLQYPGKVKAAQDLSLAFRVSGTIEQMAVEEGAKVRKGQLLAMLDPTDYQVQLQATEAEYRQIKADAERVMALYADSATTASNHDKARYGLEQITAKYRHHQDQLAYTRLCAPIDGYIQKRLFDAHETVGAGMPVISMIGSGRPEVEINLPAAEYIRRNQFSSFDCTFDLYPGHRYPLTLLSITPKANANQLYTMRLQLADCGNSPLPAPGMSTTVTIHCAPAADDQGSLFTVPTTALFDSDGTTCLYVFFPSDQTIGKLAVTILRPLGNGHMVISSSHLQEGSLIVSSGIHFVSEGQQVRPLLPASATNVGALL